MGESSIVQASVSEKKMGESVGSGLTIDSSVSFGRFENDSLSWEKWSTFSQNKYLEEVEKCSTPGSVAQKKAYFEAHYKNIAARKAELEQEKAMEPAPPMSGQSKCENDSNYTGLIVCDGEGSTEEVVKQESAVRSVVNYTTIDDVREDVGERSIEGIEKEVAVSSVVTSTTSEDIREDVGERSNEEAKQEMTVYSAVNGTTYDDEIREVVGERFTEGVEHEAAASSVVSSTTFDDDIREVVGERSTEGVEHEAAASSVVISPTFDDDIREVVGERSTEGVKHEAATSSIVSSTTFEDIREDVISSGECQSSLVEEIKEELNSSQSVNTMAIHDSNDVQKVTLLEEEHTSRKNFPNVVKKQPLRVDKDTKKAPEIQKKNLKVQARNITQKKTPIKKDQTLAATKKKVISPAAKSSPVSAPRLSRATPTSSSKSATSQSSSKKSNGTLLSRNKNTPVGENRRAAPTSMHMSLNLGQANSSVSPALTRKSLIMEQMADKDIIKRAFKSFQNNIGQPRSSSNDKIDGRSQVSAEEPERKVTPSLTPRKENEGLMRSADKRTPQRGQLGNKFSSAPSGLGSSATKKNVNAVSPSVGLKSDEKAEKRREFLKKLEQKSTAREVERAQLSAKPKEKDADMEKGKQNSKLIGTPARTYSKGGVSLSLRKEGVKNKVHLQNR